MKQRIQRFFKPGKYDESYGFTEMGASLSRSTISVVQLVGKMKVVFEKTFPEEVWQVAPGDPEWVGVLDEVKKGASKEKRYWLLDERLLYYKSRLYISNIRKLKVRIGMNDYDS